MPYNRYKCDPAVKFLCRNHGKCARERHRVFTATGTELVQYAVSKGDLQLSSTCVFPEGFSLEDEYSVCKNMHMMLSGMDHDGDKPSYIHTVHPFFLLEWWVVFFHCFFLHFFDFQTEKEGM